MAAMGGTCQFSRQREKDMPENPPAVALRFERNVAIATIVNPPVNALSTAVRAGLISMLEAVAARPDTTALVLEGGTGQFIAGADIREMDSSPEKPFLPDVIAAFDAFPLPLIAAIDGPALGGGLEVALACDYRLAGPKAIAGLPEVNLGIIPGAGGTQRLPRLIGVPLAISLIGEAQILPAAKALELGIFDAICTEDLIAEAIARAPSVTKRRISSLATPPASPEAIEAAAKAVRRRAKGNRAIQEVPDVIAAALSLSFEEGLAKERETFLRLRASPQAAALRSLFKAERAAGRMPAGLQGEARTITSAAVIGGGTMGAGIAAALAGRNVPVIVIERDEAAADSAARRVDTLFDKLAASGRASAETVARQRALIEVDSNWERVSSIDLVIEAAFEALEVKQEIFEKLDRLANPDAILATNTSYLDIDAIAAATSRPERVIGLHFFSPANVMKLLEVVRGAKTGADAIATGLAFGRKLGKLPVLAGNCDGFIGNRIYAVYRRHAEYLVEDGASPQHIDRALEDYGFAMGIFAVSDMSGLDIAHAMRQRRAASRDPAERYSTIADRLVEGGRLGRKTGAGWYRYDENGGKQVDPAVTEIIDAVRRENGITPQDFTPEDIQQRLLAVMVNEAARILDEGIAASAADIDLVLVNGYGFPRVKGGPIHAANAAGLEGIVAEIRLAQVCGGPTAPVSARILAALAEDRPLT
jgi:3-hydroxyacyl-CoA dehydrogenase